MNPLGLRRLSADAFLSFARQFLAGLFQLGNILFISRLLGPAGAGAYTIALLLPTLLAQVLNFGIGQANVYFVASGQFEASEAWAASRDLMSGVSLAGLVLAVGLIRVGGSTLFPGSNPSLLLLAMLVFPPIMLSSTIISINQGLQNFRDFNLIMLGQPAVAFLLMVILWAVSAFSLMWVVVAIVASHFFTLALGAALLSRTLPIFVRSRDARSYLLCALKYGSRVQLANLVGFLIYRIDVFLLNLFAGAAATGIYTVAVRLVEQLWIISQAVSTVLLPRLASMMSEDENRGMLTSLVSRIVLWLTAAMAALLAVVAVPVIDALFGPTFEAAGSALLFLLPGVVLVSSSRVLGNDLAARGMVGSNVALALLTLSVNVIGNLLLIPRFGLAGAAGGTSIAYVSDFLGRLVVMRRASGMDWWNFVAPSASDYRRVKAVFPRKWMG